MRRLLVALPGQETLGRDIARQLGLDFELLDVHQFPDGESLVTLPGELSGADVAFLATLNDPDRLALPLRFASATARELGALRVGLIAPYLAYMRQDRRFEAGQAVSAPLFADFLSESFDWLVTADPHLHRISDLKDLFSIPTRKMSTAGTIARWITDHITDAFLVGPDEESRQWVEEVARLANCPWETLTKTRKGDLHVEVSLPETRPPELGTPVILDDIASSGRTLIRTIERLCDRGARPPVCIVIHAVFAGDACAEILAAGASRIVSTDSIPHPTNEIGLARLLSEATLKVMRKSGAA